MKHWWQWILPVALVAFVALVIVGMLLTPRIEDRPQKPPSWAEEFQKIARESRVAEPVPPSLAGGASARAYAICFDLSSRKDRPSDCKLSSAFVFATESCKIDYRGLDVAHHQACALECADGCFVLDGLFAGVIGCEEWRDALASTETCRYELREGIRLGPDDDDGTPTQIERDAAHMEIESRKNL